MTGEYIDGGYWYVLPTVINEHGDVSVDAPSADWCAWYSGDYSLAAVRTPEPVEMSNAIDIPVSDIIGSEIPFGRVGGM